MEILVEKAYILLTKKQSGHSGWRFCPGLGFGSGFGGSMFCLWSVDGSGFEWIFWQFCILPRGRRVTWPLRWREEAFSILGPPVKVVSDNKLILCEYTYYIKITALLRV